MDITYSGTVWNYSDSRHFNGIPCRVFEGYDIILEKQGKTTWEFVESVEFKMLLRAGVEAHFGAFG